MPKAVLAKDSRESQIHKLLLHVPVNQPPRPRRGIHRQFGPAVDPPTSRGQLSRSPSPSSRQNITNSDSHLAITTTYVHSHVHDADEGRSPVVHIQSPSTDSLPTTLKEQSMATAHSTPSYPAMGQPETTSQHSTIASSATLEFFSPEGSFVHMFHSEELQKSRYDDATTM